MGLIAGSRRSPGTGNGKKGRTRGKKNPTPVILPEKYHGQRSLAGYSPWGHKESDTTEQLNKSSSVKEPK